MLSLNPSRRDMSGAETKACRPSRKPRVAPCRLRETQGNLKRSITSDLVPDDLNQIFPSLHYAPKPNPGHALIQDGHGHYEYRANFAH